MRSAHGGTHKAGPRQPGARQGRLAGRRLPQHLPEPRVKALKTALPGLAAASLALCFAAPDGRGYSPTRFSLFQA